MSDLVTACYRCRGPMGYDTTWQYAYCIPCKRQRRFDNAYRGVDIDAIHYKLGKVKQKKKAA